MAVAASQSGVHPFAGDDPDHDAGRLILGAGRADGDRKAVSNDGGAFSGAPHGFAGGTVKIAKRLCRVFQRKIKIETCTIGQSKRCVWRVAVGRHRLCSDPC